MANYFQATFDEIIDTRGPVCRSMLSIAENAECRRKEFVRPPRPVVIMDLPTTGLALLPEDQRDNLIDLAENASQLFVSSSCKILYYQIGQ